MEARRKILMKKCDAIRALDSNEYEGFQVEHLLAEVIKNKGFDVFSPQASRIYCDVAETPEFKTLKVSQTFLSFYQPGEIPLGMVFYGAQELMQIYDYQRYLTDLDSCSFSDKTKEQVKAYYYRMASGFALSDSQKYKNDCLKKGNNDPLTVGHITAKTLSELSLALKNKEKEILDKAGVKPLSTDDTKGILSELTDIFSLSR